MRIRYLGNLHDMLGAGAETLADEYLSVTHAVDHEFRDEAERSRYAGLLHAYGMHTHAIGFPAALAERASDAVKPVCGRCGSDSLARDASARWDADAQAWIISGVYDCTFCDDCSAESDDLCEWIPLTASVDETPAGHAGRPAVARDDLLS
jgi:hypothetical protein